MPLPEPREQEGESVKAGQEPSPESPEPGTDVVPAAPKKPRKFSKLVLLTASKDSAKVVGAKCKGVHCIMSLGVPGPATLIKALLKIHPEAQQAIEAAPRSLSGNIARWTQIRLRSGATWAPPHMMERKTEGWQGSLPPAPQWVGRSPPRTPWCPPRPHNPANCSVSLLG
ncbi:hypothetical protein MC885_011196 [Smutsia gigantea]|nr:hypothetical protein MC885_011196 [Smutsia gigantea]